MNFKKYKYNMIVIKITNDEDSANTQKYLFGKGIIWNGSNRNLFHFNFDNDKCLYLFVTLNDIENVRGISHSYYILQSNRLDKVHISKFNTDPIIYDINDMSKIKSIIERGDITPTYKPKRIERFI